MCPGHINNSDAEFNLLRKSIVNILCCLSRDNIRALLFVITIELTASKFSHLHLTMDLYKAIKSLQVLNIEESESTISASELGFYESIKDADSFIVSDVDEELIILIEFSQIIELKSIKLYAHQIEIEDASAPKQIQNYDFEDMKVFETR